MIRSIPPRTMRDVWKREKGIKPQAGKMPIGGPVGIGISLGGLPAPEKEIKKEKPRAWLEPKRFKKPRGWVYTTKPFFKKVKEPLIDVFKEAKEVRVIMDLGGFMRGDIDFKKIGDKFVISGKHDDYEYTQEISLPPGVDIDKIEEHFKNGILELILPKEKRKKKRS